MGRPFLIHSYWPRGLAGLMHWTARGKGEEIYSVPKHDLAGVHLNFAKFGAQCTVLADCRTDLLPAPVQYHAVLTPKLGSHRMQALRFHVLCLPIGVVRQARRLHFLLPSAFD